MTTLCERWGPVIQLYLHLRLSWEFFFYLFYFFSCDFSGDCAKILQKRNVGPLRKARSSWEIKAWLSTGGGNEERERDEKQKSDSVLQTLIFCEMYYTDYIIKPNRYKLLLKKIVSSVEDWQVFKMLIRSYSGNNMLYISDMVISLDWLVSHTHTQKTGWRQMRCISSRTKKNSHCY